METSRRDLLKLSTAGAALTGLSIIGTAQAQVAEEANTDPLSITRKGINKKLQVMSADILEDQAKEVLSSAVFTSDFERGVRFARGIVAGMTHINDITVDDQPNAPFGGEKNSGLGRFNGEWAMEEFTRAHWITLQHLSPAYPF